MTQQPHAKKLARSIKRRDFLASMAPATALSLGLASSRMAKESEGATAEQSGQSATQAPAPPAAAGSKTNKQEKPAHVSASSVAPKTWLFWDWWHVEHQDNLELRQGVARWRSEGTYEDPTCDYLGMWPMVWRDEPSGKWRMLYIVTGFPLSLMAAESDDGMHWHPMDRPDIKPPGGKLSANHLFTVERANGGPIYHDPVATDGRPFKFYCIQRGGPAAARAKLDPNSYFHEIVAGEGVKPYMADQVLAASADGLHWELDETARWGEPPWHPDPPVACYWSPHRGKHVMVTRPGWGDRRIAVQTSDDALRWEDLELIMQPDPLDPPQVQLYGMPVIPYEGQYVGLLWMAHFSSSHRLARFNQLWGSIDCQLTYSFDGEHFQRGIREPFVPLNEPGQPGSGVVYPTCMIEHEGELRIYSAATPDLHHQYAKTQFERKGKNPPSAIILHTLRKDGFTYLESRGNWGSLTTKPLTLLGPGLRLNVAAPYGEVRFQATDLSSRPLKGMTFDECVPVCEADSLDWEICWKEKSTADLVGQVFRLEMVLRNARVYAVRGAYHFLDALDIAMNADNKPIDTSLFDF